MKATKKIVGATCALVAAVALSAGSTFAWFASNTTVKANGMSVQASTAKNLVISTNSTTGNSESETAASTYTGTVTLSPVSTASLATTPDSSFFKITGGNSNVDYSSGTAGNGVVYGAAEVKTSGTSADVVKHTFYIRVDGIESDSYTNLYISSVSVGAPAQNISKAIRIGVVCGTYNYIFAPVSGATSEYKGVKAAGAVTEDDTNNVYSTENVRLATAGEEATLGAVTTAYSTVNIYIWYEGQDAACTAANSISVETLNLEITFNAA